MQDCWLAEIAKFQESIFPKINLLIVLLFDEGLALPGLI